jgi:hypothetical protein
VVATNALDSARLIYAAMAARSIPASEAGNYLAPFGAPMPESIERVYVGSLIRLFRRLGYVSLGTYHTHKNNLIAMGSIRRIQQGRFKHTPSIWALLREPTATLWIEHVGQHVSQRDAEIYDEHERRVSNFLETAPTLYPRLLQQARCSGVKTRDDFLRYLASLPETTLRSLHPLCLAFEVPGTIHSCGIPPLDDLAVSSHAGSWKRNRDARRRLQGSPSP